MTVRQNDAIIESPRFIARLMKRDEQAFNQLVLSLEARIFRLPDSVKHAGGARGRGKRRPQGTPSQHNVMLTTQHHVLQPVLWFEAPLLHFQTLHVVARPPTNPVSNLFFVNCPIQSRKKSSVTGLELVSECAIEEHPMEQRPSAVWPKPSAFACKGFRPSISADWPRLWPQECFETQGFRPSTSSD